ncbi:hypothetical protein M1N16_01610 [Nitrospinaceae bacterium]|nr:hypothetical protein [Nitrospinaceae bacterium]
MEIKKETLEKILNSDVNFKRLYSEHAKLKLKIENLNKIKFPTAHEEIEKKQHQKQKLILKDKMEEIFSQVK